MWCIGDNGTALDRLASADLAVDGRITGCLVDGVLAFVGPAFPLLLTLLWLLLFRKDRSRPPRSTQTPLNVVKWIACLVLLVFTVFELAENVIFEERYSDNIPVSAYLGPLANAVGVMLNMYLYSFCDLRGILPSPLSTPAYHIISTAVRAMRLYVFIDQSVSPTDVRLWTTIVQLVTLVTLVAIDVQTQITLRLLPRPPVKQENDGVVYRDNEANIVSQLLFWWYSFVLEKGAVTPLQTEDLGRVPEVDSASFNANNFDFFWKRELASGRQNLWFVYMRAYAVPMALAGLCMGTGVILSYAGPLCLNGIVLDIQRIQSGEKEFVTLPEYAADPRTQPLLMADVLQDGYVLSISLLLATCFQTVLVQHHHHLVMRAGVDLRSALQTLIYKKALRLSTRARQGANVGEILNHMSVDAQRPMMMLNFIHYSWASPLQIALALVLLISTLGLSSLAGVSIIVVSIALQGYLARLVGSLQSSSMKANDFRCQRVTEALGGIRTIKFQAWEPFIFHNISEARKNQLQLLFKLGISRAGIATLGTATPVLMTLVAFTVYALVDPNQLTPAKAMTTLALFSMLRMPLFLLPVMINAVVDANIATKRLKSFFLADEVDPDAVSYIADGNSEQADSSAVPSQKPQLAAKIDKASFSWSDVEGTNLALTLTDISLDVPRGKLTMVVGPVGSGKSSLISAMLGEIKRVSGPPVILDSSIAYTAQSPWLLNATLRDNILFFKPFDEKWYNHVIEICCLKPDLAQLPGGDMCEIGERGLTLSGGQKQRVCIARSIYQDASLYLFDDTLSALDAYVGAAVFTNVIQGELIKRGKTVVMSTNQLHHVAAADHLVLLQDGRITRQGPFDSIKDDVLEAVGRNAANSAQTEQSGASAPKDADQGDLATRTDADEDSSEEQPLLEASSSTGAEDAGNSDSKANESKKLRTAVSPVSQQTNSSENDTKKAEKKAGAARTGEAGQLIEKEERSLGAVKTDVYLSFISAAGFLPCFLVVLSQMTTRAGLVLNDWWLTQWSSDDGDNPTHPVVYWLVGYTLIGMGAVVVSIMTSINVSFTSVRAARSMHAKLLLRVLLAPMAFFDTTPTGRIINRFSSDMDTIDTKLTDTLSTLLDRLFSISAITPLFMVVIVPMFVLYYFIQNFFRKSSRELQRIESLAKSPIFSQFQETLGGIATIRACQMQNTFTAKILRNIDAANNAFLFLNTANRYLGVRLDLLGATIVFAASLASVINAKSVDPGLAGLSLNYALMITAGLNWLVRSLADAEMQMNAVERVKQYTEIDNEAMKQDIDAEDPSDLDPSISKCWPERGSISFEGVIVSYRPHLPPVLNSLTVSVAPGEKIGICGRTGSGKSSTVQVLFQMMRYSQGRILIDGVDISTISLRRLRSSLAVIPQDPYLFAGSIRNNLDFSGRKADAELWKALEVAQLKETFMNLPDKLDSPVLEGGSNFSQGEQQLICLARAFLKNSKIMIMDEATAAIDEKTDEYIQQALRSDAFKGVTVLTVAHRLATILDYDKIMVLDAGKLIEFGPPEQLLTDPNGAFRSLVDASNKEKEK